MKLAYMDLPLDASGPPAVVLHREGVNSTERVAEFATGCGLFSRVAVPTGEYAFYPSGMSIGGTCWYRILPGFEGTDPISLTTAVVEVADLLADLALAQPVLVGWGQGAVVALGVALWRGDAVGSVVCVDARTAHISLLPPTVFASAHPPPVLLAGSEASLEPELEKQQELLAGHGVASTTWCWSGEATPSVLDAALDKALAARIGKWLDGEVARR
jgi:pimeloyl-ACP methyl ester carboxylesterase